jgi:hypothetical protein
VNIHQDLEELMNTVVQFAEKMLLQHAEFIPFGAAMKPNHEIVYVAGDDGNERPASSDIIKLLEASFQKCAQNEYYKATAIAYDVLLTIPETTTKSDAIVVALDHVDSLSTLVILPYSLKNGSLETGKPFAEKGKNIIFS